MITFLSKLFDTTDFPARWLCGTWSAAHGWLHILSDIAIFGAYFAIPVLLIYYKRSKQDISFPKIFWLFTAFIIACGTVHLIEATIFWAPVYRLSGAAKLATAIISWATVIGIVQVMPQALKLPGLASMNTLLEKEVTEKEAIGNRLQESEARLQRAIEGSADSLWEWDIENDKIWWSCQFHQTLGYNTTELPSSIDAFMDLLHPDDVEATKKAINDTQNFGERYDIEYRLRGKAQEYHWFRVRGTMYEETGGRKLFAGSLQEITEKKRTSNELGRYAKELERSNKELDDFAYVASHDLKAPLRAIATLSEWISEDEETKLSQESEAHFDKLKRRVTRMNRLLDDLLLYSRVGRESYPHETVSIQEMIQDIASDLSPDDRLKVNVDSATLKITTMSTPLEQVFRNLLSNAFKHHDQEQCAVEITHEVDGEFVVFKVTDDGPGIDPRFHQKIFEMFETLRPRDEVEGSGMGLAVVMKIIGRYGGTIDVQSEPGIRGTTFRFTWPLNIDNPVG